MTRTIHEPDYNQDMWLHANALRGFSLGIWGALNLPSTESTLIWESSRTRILRSMWSCDALIWVLPVLLLSDWRVGVKNLKHEDIVIDWSDWVLQGQKPGRQNSIAKSSTEDSVLLFWNTEGLKPWLSFICLADHVIAGTWGRFSRVAVAESCAVWVERLGWGFETQLLATRTLTSQNDQTVWSTALLFKQFTTCSQLFLPPIF